MDLNTVQAISINGGMTPVQRWTGENGDVIWEQLDSPIPWLLSSLAVLPTMGKRSAMTSGGIWIEGAYQEQSFWNGYWQVLQDQEGYSDYFNFYKVTDGGLYYGLRGVTRIQTLAWHETVQPDIGFSRMQDHYPYATYIQSYSDHAGNLLACWANKQTSGRYLDWTVTKYWQDGFDPDTGMPIEQEQVIGTGRMTYRYYNPYGT